MMELKVDLFSNHQSNYAVVKLPGRRFPGVVFQGDSLNTLCADVEQAYRLACTTSANVELQEQIEGILEHLKEVQADYEEVMQSHGLSLPYPKANHRG